MVDSRRHAFAVALAFALALPGCGGVDRNQEPILAAVPAQTTAGGPFSLDLGPFATDPENGLLVFQVVSGGGSFTGSVYGHTFDTLGSYVVEYRVWDDQANATSGSFDVTVTTANLAVIQTGDDLELLDTDTRAFRTVTGAVGATDTLVGTLPRGHVVYERTAGTTRLFVYDPSTTQTFALGDSPLQETRFVAVTPANHVLFTTAATATPADTDLWIWSAETGSARAISAAAGAPDGNAAVGTDGRIFYERSTPADVLVYDPATDTSSPVATAATAEAIAGVLPGGGLAFSRVGGGGELDLLRYHPLAGVVEIGVDAPAIAGQSKTFRGATSDGKIVFEVQDPTSIDLYVWDPATASTTQVAATAVDETFAAITPSGEVVFSIATAPANADLGIYTPGGTPAVRTISADVANDLYRGALSNGDVVVLREAGTGDELHLYDTSASSLNALATSGTDDYTFDAVLESDKVAYTRAGASGGVFVVNTTGAPMPVLVGGPGSRFGGETGGGDFVVEALAGAEFDLVLWDDSASATVPVSTDPGDDSFGSGTPPGDVLFERIMPGKTTADLFLWTLATATVTPLTDTTQDHSVLATYSAGL